MSTVANTNFPLNSPTATKPRNLPTRADTAQTSFAVAPSLASSEAIEQELRQLRTLFN